MAKAYINTFGGGIVNDSRSTSSDVARVVSNFDINTSPNQLIPYHSSEDGNSNAANDLMQNWCIAKNTATPASASDFSLFGLGRQTATDKVRIFKKALTVTSTDLSDNGWTETAANLGTQTNPNYNCFAYYANQGLIFGLHGARYIWSYDPTGGGFSDTLFDLTSFTTCANAITHNLDDVLYLPVDNKIYSKNGAGIFTLALTLPSKYYITSICENSTYIDIAAAPIGGVGDSHLFRWNRSSTLATLTENINWGSGSLKIVEELEGFTVGISLDGGFGGATTTRLNDRVRFQYYTGSGVKSFFEILGATSTNLPIIKQKINNRLYFMMSITLNGAVREGVWSFGKNPNGQGFNLVHERTPNNDTALVSGTLRGFFYVGDYLFQGYVNNSSVHGVSKTDNGAVYSHTSTFESVINEGMQMEHKLKLKQFNSIIIGYASLPAISGQVVVKCKVDGGSYVIVRTCTTTGVNFIEMPFAGLGVSKGREIEFRLESTLGASIIHFEYDYDAIPTLA